MENDRRAAGPEETTGRVPRWLVVSCVALWVVALCTWPILALADRLLGRPEIYLTFGPFQYTRMFDVGASVFIVGVPMAAAVTVLATSRLRAPASTLARRALRLAGFASLAVLAALVTYFVAVYTAFFFLSGFLGGSW